MGFVLSVLLNLITIYYWMLIAYILMSWLPNARESSIGQFLARVAEPFLEPFRKIIPPIGMIDISPLVAIIALRFATEGLRVVFGTFM